MEPILKAEDLTKIFSRKGQPDFTAVNHISFKLMPGECLGIIGESGSGKTTVVNMITRLLDVTGGRIVLDACRLLRSPAHAGGRDRREPAKRRYVRKER